MHFATFMPMKTLAGLPSGLRHLIRHLLLASALLSAGCSNDRLNTRGAPGADGDSRVQQDGDVDRGGDPVVECPVETLDAQAMAGNVVQANMLILLDHSGSMGELVAAGSDRRWDLAVGAINQIVSSHSSAIRFGLSHFPAAGDCLGPGAQLAVAVGDDSGAAIEQALTNLPDPVGASPINAALQFVLDDPTAVGLGDPDRADYILLLTDGEESCTASAAADDTLDSLRAIGVETFVVGFMLPAISGALNCYALHGGEHRTAVCPDLDLFNCLVRAEACYFEADDLVALETMLIQITAGITSCVFVFDAPPASASDFEVYMQAGVNVTSLPHDPTHTHGWDYDSSTGSAEIFGGACTAIKNGFARPRFVASCVPP